MSVPSVPALLDTAIPMYAAGMPHPYRDACQWVMTEIANGRIQVVIDSDYADSWPFSDHFIRRPL